MDYKTEEMITIHAKPKPEPPVGVWVSIKEYGLPLDKNDGDFYCFAEWYPAWKRWIGCDTMSWQEFKDFRNFELENNYTHYFKLPNCICTADDLMPFGECNC